MLKKILVAALLAPLVALAQSYPSPTLNNVTVNGTLTTAHAAITGGTITGLSSPIPVASGGTGASSITSPGGAFDTLCSSTVGQMWVRLTGGWGCLSLSFVNPVWWGADPTGVASSTSAFASAIATNKSVMVPDGNFVVAENTIILGSGQTLQGTSPGAYVPAETPFAGTIITCNTNGGHACIAIPANSNWVHVRDLTVIRTAALGTLTSGSDGVAFQGPCSHCELINVETYNHYRGIVLGDTAYSIAQNLITENNTSHGLWMTNFAGTGGFQWTLSNVLSQSNGGVGVLVSSQNISGAAGMSMSNWDRVQTYGNNSFGIEVLGSATQPIYGPRCSNCFMGQDGNTELYVQNYGGDVQLSNSFLELVGTSTTGPNNTTTASHSGNGVEIYNGKNTQINNNTIIQMSQHGILIDAGASHVQINGNQILDNGQTNGDGVVVSSGATAIDITSNVIANSSGTTQLYGIVNNGTINVSVGNDLKPNTTGTYTGTAATIGGATLNNQ